MDLRLSFMSPTLTSKSSSTGFLFHHTVLHVYNVTTIIVDLRFQPEAGYYGQRIDLLIYRPKNVCLNTQLINRIR